MASLIVMLLPLCLLATDGSPGQNVDVSAATNMPRNVFEDPPYCHRYHNWWCPYRTKYEPDTVRRLQKHLDEIAPVSAAGVDVAAEFGADSSSAFLYPVLAANGPKGAAILERLLSTYADGGRLDDRWLLVVAGLGRNVSAGTEDILSKELDRVLREYDFSPAARAANARLPVADALLACKAARQSLTAADITSVYEQFGERSQRSLLWTIGLYWARKLMPAEDVVGIYEDGFAGCSDADLLGVMDMRPNSNTADRAIALRNSAISTRAVWPITRSLLLRESQRRKVLSEFMVVLYSLVLVTQAADTDGRYDIDEDVIDAVCRRNVETRRFLARNCWILARCEPSMKSERWEAFLHEHASRLPEDSRLEAKAMLDRILGPKDRTNTGLYDDKPRSPETSEPGVHLLGFSGAGGRIPERASETGSHGTER